ncbi:MAG TPA: STAS domain-containing protein [Candidatus Brocadiia bacterium]|nr:STAS domain-containing protein [Candidatus Brocadiia bacterium]
MNVETAMTGQDLLVKAAGRIDSETAPRFEEQLAPRLAEARSVVIDAAGVEYLSSAGVRAVLRAALKMTAQKGTLKLRGVRREVAKVLALAGLEELIEGGGTA